MTCIVGLTDDDGSVYIGGDSCSSNGHFYDRAAVKVFSVGEYLIGTCGSSRGRDLLRYDLSPPTPKEDENPDRYIRTAFTRAVRKAFKSGNFIKTKDGVETHGTPFLIGWRGRLWNFQADFSVQETMPRGCAWGSGYIAATGSLHSTQGLAELEPWLRVRYALEAAEEVVTTVRGPFVVWRLNTDGTAEMVS